MSYAIEWASPALRSLQRLPHKIGAAVVECVYGGLAEDPTRVGRPLRWELEGLHVARRGDYCVVHRIDDTRHVVIIEAVAHRADIYRPS